MLIEEQQRHAAALKAAEKYVAWLKQADDYDVNDVASVLGDVMVEAGIQSLEYVLRVPPDSRLFVYNLEKKKAA